MFRKLLIIIFSIYFVFAGTGYTVADYCCDICQEEGIEHVSENLCNPEHLQVHHCDEKQSSDLTEIENLNFSDENHCCELLRFIHDDYNKEHGHNKLIAPEFLIFNYSSFEHACFPIAGVGDDWHVPDTLRFSTGRDILAQIRVLII